MTGPSERRPPPWECHGATAREDEQEARTPTSYNNHMKMSEWAAASGALRGARPFVGRGGRRDCTPVCRLCARRDDDVSYSLMLPEPRAHLPWDTPRATAATSATSTTSTTSDKTDPRSAHFFGAEVVFRMRWNLLLCRGAVVVWVSSFLSSGRSFLVLLLVAVFFLLGVRPRRHDGTRRGYLAGALFRRDTGSK